MSSVWLRGEERNGWGLESEGGTTERLCGFVRDG
jgi:hypothetical protein